MYELYVGSNRFIGAITRRMDDPEFMGELADLLSYQLEQLPEDIQALCDRLEQNERR